jgi:hypothetical protein
MSYRTAILTLAAIFSTASVLAQQPKQPPITLEHPLAPPSYSVTEVAPDGSLRLVLAPGLPRNAVRFIAGPVSEGYYILLAGKGLPAGPWQVLRVQVTDVADESITAKTSPVASALVKVGDGASLLRPPGSTTALLRSLPDVIPLPAQGDREAEAAWMERNLKRAGSVNNLKQIGLAFHNFEATFNEFPPAVVNGPDGKPWHSWRVLILPYLGQGPLFNEYDFSQPWDSEKNRKLLERMPAVYRDPIYGDAKEPYTHYAALVGPGAIFKPEAARQTDPKKLLVERAGTGIARITDGTSNTVLVSSVEPGRRIPWTKPEDINVGPGFAGLGKPGGIATPYTLGGKPDAPATAPFLFADGAVRTLAVTIAPTTLQALFTAYGGEVVDSNTLPGDASNQPASLFKLKIRVEGDKSAATIE